jgi:hypothetical protein
MKVYSLYMFLYIFLEKKNNRLKKVKGIFQHKRVGSKMVSLNHFIGSLGVFTLFFAKNQFRG